MVTNKRRVRWLVGTVILAVAECAAVVALDAALTQPAWAQWFGGDDRNRRAPRSSGGFFGSFFGSPERRVNEGEPAQPVDNSRAPSPRKPDPKAEPVTPTTSIVVMGDGMADWLAYGLEDAFADTPEVAIVRKNKQHSGLLRYEAKGDLDWWHVARDQLVQEKANYVVMMLGVGDRQNIREKDLAKEADKKGADKKNQSDKGDANKTAANKDASSDNKDSATPTDSEDADQPSIVAPEPTPGKKANGIIEFRTDKWAEVYSRRIDETIAALKSKGVPVFWVGLPSIRGTKSTADTVYLNDLYRARVERAGAVYIDVWDGFVDEGGKFTTFGPDYEGQNRRLRSGDGVYFTKNGARKLAHYVEREIRRYMSNRSLQVSLPSGPAVPAPAESRSTVRPLAGPVVPLTVTPSNSEELLGGGAGAIHSDALAARVLMKGEPVAAPPGRADDFIWRPGGEANASAQPTATPTTQTAPKVAVPAAAPPVASAYVEPPAVVEKKSDAKTPAPKTTAKTVQNTAAKPKTTTHNTNVPRPPAPVGRSSNPFGGWFR